MIETIKDAPQLFEDFQLDVDPTKPIDVNNKEAKKAEEKINQLSGIIKTNSQQADELSKLLLGEEDTEETKTEEEKKDETKDTSSEKKEEETKSKEEEKVDSKKEDDSDKGYSFKGILEYLDEEGVVDYDDEIKKLDDTPELLTISINKKIENGIKSYKESLPEIVSELTDYIEQGGDPARFLESLYKPIDVTKLDLDEEKDQELVVREYLKHQDLDPEDIDELIQSYKDGLILDKQAKVASKKIDSIYAKQTEQLVQEQQEIVEQKRVANEKYINSIKDTITTSKDLAGLQISEKEKKEFSDYLLKVNPKTGQTKYQEDLSKDYVKSSVELAYLKYKNYDFSKAEKAGASKATKEFKDKIFTKQEKAPSGRTQDEAKAIDFSAFRSFGYTQGK